jgi:hypothetical protein
MIKNLFRQPWFWPQDVREDPGFINRMGRVIISWATSSPTFSNSPSCHQRASYPAEPFLPVTWGANNLRQDLALASDRLRTSFPLICKQNSGKLILLELNR